MKKHLVLVAVLGLLLLPVLNPSLSSIPAVIGNEHQEAMFSTAADGDESSESITSFSETLDDDVLFVPDVFDNSTAHLAVAGSAFPGTGYGSYLKTHVDDGDNYETTLGEVAYIILNFTLSSSVSQYESFRIHAQIICSVTLSDGMIQVQDYEDNWINITDLAPGSNIYNIDEDFGNSTFWAGFVGPTLSIRVYKEYIGANTYVAVDFMHIYPSHMTLADGGHYAESFADVSDWTFVSDTSAGRSFVTDGDVLNFTIEYDDGGNEAAYYNVTFESALPLNSYLEIRFKTSVTAGSTKGACVQIYLDDTRMTWWSGGSYHSPSHASWVTYKFYIGNWVSSEPTSLKLGVDDSSNSHASDYGYALFDYLRIGPSDEMGWQHDCSTTAATRTFSASTGSVTLTSDDDKLHLSGTYDNYAGLIVEIDDTTTESCLKLSDYPFFEFNMNASTSQDIRIKFWDENLAETYYTGYVETNAFTTTRINLKALVAGGYVNQIGIYDHNDNAQDFYVDWIKCYSVANSSIALTNTGTDDYLYISATGCIRGEVSGATTFIDLTWDPVLSVDTSVYNVWNTSGCSCLTGIKVGGSWSVWTAETRGGMDAGTLTSFGFRFCCCEAGCICVKDIKFISDGTAPDILDKFLDPGEPYDDETVTITAVAYDAIEVYKCTINAVVSPAGFSDIDYEMIETDQEHVYTHDFATLTAGYYLFQVRASDGANTYDEYISVRVREAEILITTYTFFGASSDFSFMQFSGYINRDCTYNISEWSASWPVNETHTGSVSEGMFNIAWDKIGVDDLEANFTIIFVNGSLSKTVPGYYGTAYKELRITEIEFENVEESQAVTNITVNFYTNKDIDWFVYDRDDSDAVLASGSSLEGMDVLTWVKDRTPYAHKYAIKWTDGVSNIWVNSSYWTYRENIDSLDQPGKDWDAADARRTIEFWTTLGAFVAIGGIIAIGIVYYKLNKKIGNLPNYRTQ